MVDWSVTVDYELPDASGLPDDVADALVDALGDSDAALSLPTVDSAPRVGVTLTVQGQPDALAAAAAGAAVVGGALRTAGVRGSALVGVESITTAEQDERSDAAALPELVGAAQAGDMLGVSRQRVHTLAAEHPDFPAPILQIPRLGSLWLATAIRGFAARWDRRPGRRKTA